MTSMLLTERMEGADALIASPRNAEDPLPYPPPLRGRGRPRRRESRLPAVGHHKYKARRLELPLPRSGGGYGRGPSASHSSLRLAVASLRALRPAGVLLGIGLGGFVDQRLNRRVVGGNGVGDFHPFRAVPLLDEGRAMAVVVGAGQFERRDESGQAQRFHPSGVEINVL